MSNENELVPMSELGISTEMDSKFDTLIKTSDFLPQLRVYGSESSIVKEGGFPMGHFGLYFASNNILDLGIAFDNIVIAARPRACIVTGDQPVSFYNFDSKEFQDVLAGAKSKVPGYLAGLEYLLWIPSVKQFGLFLMGSITLRRESPNVKALVGKGCTLKINLIKTAKYTWHGAQAFPCSLPMEMPDMEELSLEVEKFKNPVESQVELAEDTKGRAR